MKMKKKKKKKTNGAYDTGVRYCVFEGEDVLDDDDDIHSFDDLKSETAGYCE
jgi:hypothetical protein